MKPLFITEVFLVLSSIYSGNQNDPVLEDKKDMYPNEIFSVQCNNSSLKETVLLFTFKTNFLLWKLSKHIQE